MGNRLEPIIYGLLDPRPERSGELRYIGKSKYGLARARVEHDAHCGRWQRLLKSIGMTPIPVVLYRATSGDDEHLYAVEAALIAAYRADGANLTNIADGGGGSRGAIPSVETRQKMSRSHTGRKYPPRSAETLLRMSEAQRGHRHSEATRRQMSESRRGQKRTPEQCARIAASNTGRRHSEATRAKIGAASRGRRHSPETKALLAARSTGRVQSEKTRQKLSAALRGRVRSPAHCQRLSEAAQRRRTSGT